MNLRDALQRQSPSLALQRAAADRIAKLEQLLDEVRQGFMRNEYLPAGLLGRIDEELSK